MSFHPSLDVIVFDALGIDRLLGLMLVYFLAFFVKGAVGIGSLTPTIVFSALLIDPHRAVALALMANSLSQLQFVRAGFRDGDWKIAQRVAIPNFVGAVVGVWIFGRIAASELSLLLGLALGSLVLADIVGVWRRLAERLNITHPGTILALSGFAGLVSGVTGAAGLLFLVPYLRIVCIDKLGFRGTVLLLSTIIVIWRTVVMAVSGHID